MTDLILPNSGGLEPPPGGRLLGIRVRPALRLSIGFQNPQKRGAPDKLDHFRAVEGAQGEYAGPARKFHETYGPTPKAINIRLFGELGQALDIRYKAYAGAGSEGGGVLIARGETNFALANYVGGPDTLTVYRQNGDVETLRSAGVNALTGEPLDELAKELDLMLYTTFRFGLPEVLAYGSFCEITSKGKQTTDTLWMKLRGYYGTFLNRTAFVVRPQLVVRPSTARPVIKKRGQEPQRIKTKIFVLDVIIPETEDEMIERLQQYKELTMLGMESMNQSYPQIGMGSQENAADFFDEKVGETPAPSEIADEEFVEGELVEEPELNKVSSERLEQAKKAGEAKIPVGSYQGRPLAKLLEFENGTEWLDWALQQDWSHDKSFEQALHVFTEVFAPGVWETRKP